MNLRRALLGAAAASATTLLVPAAAGPALAAPSNANTFVLDLSCSDGHDYPVIVVEKAALPAAAHVLEGGSVLIPTAFQFHVTVTDPHGTVLEDVTSPLEAVRGTSGTHRPTMSCTFTQTRAEVAPGAGEVTIRLDGTVLAYSPH